MLELALLPHPGRANLAAALVGITTFLARWPSPTRTSEACGRSASAARDGMA